MGMSDGVAGGLISAGSGLVGGIINASSQSSANRTNLKIARENNAANQQLQRQQNDWNLGQWNRENSYNSASAQKQRLLDAGYNPALAVGQVATGSATSSQLTSAPYTPANQVQVQPVTGLGNAVSNAGNDFVSSYLNTRMMAANVKKAEADADNALANAAATSGYKRDQALADMQRNNHLNWLTDLQSQYQDIQNEIQKAWGSQIAVASLENLIAQRAETMSRRDVNIKNLDKIVADTAQSWAKANNLDYNSNQIRRVTPLLLKSYELKNRGEDLQNKLLKVDSDWETQYGSMKRSFGMQGLMHDSNIKKKDDQYYWPSKGLNALGTAKSLGKTLKFSK